MIIKINKIDFVKRVYPVYKSINLLKNSMDYQNKSLIGFAGAPWTLLLYMIYKQSPKSDFNKNKIFSVIPVERVSGGGPGSYV